MITPPPKLKRRNFNLSLYKSLTSFMTRHLKTETKCVFSQCRKCFFKSATFVNTVAKWLCSNFDLKPPQKTMAHCVELEPELV